MSFFREIIIKSLCRSTYWSRARRRHLKKHGTCAACGRTTKLEVHHIRPFKDYPELELNPENLITLCANGTRCHISFGHLGNFKRSNKHVVLDSAQFYYRVHSPDSEFVREEFPAR